MNNPELGGEAALSRHAANTRTIALIGHNSLANVSLSLPNTSAKLVIATTDTPPHARYTPDEVQQRLALPAGFASGYITDSAAYHKRLRQPRAATGVAPTSRMGYRGPVYLQGKEPTCMAWSVIHAANAANTMPPVPLATDLLNRALPQHQRDLGGMDSDTARTYISRHNAGIRCRLPSRPQDGIYYADAVARLVRKAVDNTGAVVATVRDSYKSANPDKNYRRPHAICITGYAIDQDGFMDVQCIDSNSGEGRVPVELVAEELNYTSTQPLAVITGK